MNKHTPGPWTYDDDGFIYGEGEKVSSNGPCVVSDPHSSPNIDIDEREANARLIAAAPELLEELKTVLSDLVYQISAKHGPEAASKYPSVVSARATIAKATGQ